MKNLFVKEDNTIVWVVAGLTAAIAAGTGVWFYLRGKRAAEQEAFRREHAQDYLEDKRPKKKKHKTDVADLAAIVHHS